MVPVPSKSVGWDEVARRVAGEVEATFVQGRSLIAAEDVELIACWSERHAVIAVFRSRHEPFAIQGLRFDIRDEADDPEGIDVEAVAYSIVMFEIVEPNRYPEVRSSDEDAIHWRSMPPSSPIPSSAPASVAEIKSLRGRSRDV